MLQGSRNSLVMHLQLVAKSFYSGRRSTQTMQEILKQGDQGLVLLCTCNVLRFTGLARSRTQLKSRLSAASFVLWSNAVNICVDLDISYAWWEFQSTRQHISLEITSQCCVTLPCRIAPWTGDPWEVEVSKEGRDSLANQLQARTRRDSRVGTYWSIFLCLSDRNVALDFRVGTHRHLSGSFHDAVAPGFAKRRLSKGSAAYVCAPQEIS